MQEEWRYYFYYIFGILPSIFFSLRFLIQWISSEKKKQSVVSSAFWILSICGNILCAVHYYVQLQFLLFLIQVSNGYIAWRNLDLLKTHSMQFKKSLWYLTLVMVAASGLFFVQLLILKAHLHILEIPFGLSKNGVADVSIYWHILGGAGCVFFASRFWIQWVEAEKTGQSTLGRQFWLISIVGSTLALMYFVHIRDWVSSLNYSFGLIPYVRNLMLLRKLRAVK